MRRKDVKTIIAYFYGIPAQRRLLDQERAELEAEYNGLRGTSYDGMPHSSTPGKPVEELAERADAGNVWGKLEAVAVRVHVLEADREKIQDCLNAINGEYKRLICDPYHQGQENAGAGARHHPQGCGGHHRGAGGQGLRTGGGAVSTMGGGPVSFKK